MRRMDIRTALLISLALLIASPVALTTDVPQDSATTITPDAGYEYGDARGTTPAKGDLNRDGVVTPADAAIALQMAARGEYSEDVDVSGDAMVTSLDALLILQTTMAGCGVVVDEYTAGVADTIPIPIRVEGGVDVGSLDLNITFDPALLFVKSAQNGAFDSTVINLEDSGSGVVKVIAFQAANPGLNGNFVVAEISFEAFGVGESMLDLEITTLTDSSPQSNHLDHSISNGTVIICQT
jgi:hypothetical protein